VCDGLDVAHEPAGVALERKRSAGRAPALEDVTAGQQPQNGAAERAAGSNALKCDISRPWLPAALLCALVCCPLLVLLLYKGQDGAQTLMTWPGVSARIFSTASQTQQNIQQRQDPSEQQGSDKQHAEASAEADSNAMQYPDEAYHVPLRTLPFVLIVDVMLP
jgi:hypothetical protein